MTKAPPLGLIPKKIHGQQIMTQRFSDVCSAISRYYNAGLAINIEWIEEYNELINAINQSGLDGYTGVCQPEGGLLVQTK